MGQNVRANADGDPYRRNFGNSGNWPAERWSALVILACLGLLILIRMGFRGVNVLGFSARVS